MAVRLRVEITDTGPDGTGCEDVASVELTTDTATAFSIMYTAFQEFDKGLRLA